MPATPKDALGLLKSSIRNDNPVIFMESEIMYNYIDEVPDHEYLIPIGEADIKTNRAPDLTIVTWSRGYHFVLEALPEMEKAGINPEIVDLRTVRAAGREDHVRVRAQKPIAC